MAELPEHKPDVVTKRSITLAPPVRGVVRAVPSAFLIEFKLKNTLGKFNALPIFKSLITGTKFTASFTIN